MSKFFTINGFTGTLAEIAERFNINKDILEGRLNRGMSLEDAVNKPANKTRVYTIDGFTGTLAEIAEHYNINFESLKEKLDKGLPLENENTTVAED